jgi:hypothetical protein
MVHALIELKADGLLRVIVASGDEDTDPPPIQQEWFHGWLGPAVAWLSEMGGGQIVLPLYPEEMNN